MPGGGARGRQQLPTVKTVVSPGRWRDTRAVTTFEAVLPRLVATYESGRLVPFLGSGMSVPVCADWWTFVHRLESAIAGNPVAPYPKDMTRDELVRRANTPPGAPHARAP